VGPQLREGSVELGLYGGGPEDEIGIGHMPWASPEHLLNYHTPVPLFQNFPMQNTLITSHKTFHSHKKKTLLQLLIESQIYKA
jgi:hypothetical protein